MSATATSPRPSPPEAEREKATKRLKRSWTRITTALPGEDREAVAFTFWPTPAGLHRRRKGSPNVRTLTWEQVNAAFNT